MEKKGFASMYLVYSFFLVFVMMMLSVMAVNHYKKNFLNHLKEDIKNEVQSYHLEEKVEFFYSTEEKNVE